MRNGANENSKEGCTSPGLELQWELGWCAGCFLQPGCPDCSGWILDWSAPVYSEAEISSGMVGVGVVPGLHAPGSTRGMAQCLRSPAAVLPAELEACLWKGLKQLVEML